MRCCECDESTDFARWRLASRRGTSPQAQRDDRYRLPSTATMPTAPNSLPPRTAFCAVVEGADTVDQGRTACVRWLRVVDVTRGPRRRRPETAGETRCQSLPPLHSRRRRASMPDEEQTEADAARRRARSGGDATLVRSRLRLPGRGRRSGDDERHPEPLQGRGHVSRRCVHREWDHRRTPPRSERRSPSRRLRNRDKSAPRPIMATIPPAAAGASSAIPGIGSRESSAHARTPTSPTGLRHRQHGEHSHCAAPQARRRSRRCTQPSAPASARSGRHQR
jgi:hypothetical protein